MVWPKQFGFLWILEQISCVTAPMNTMFQSALKKSTPVVDFSSNRNIPEEHKHDVPHDESDVITINVGGKRFQTYNSSLKELPHTLLGDECRRDMYLNRKNGEYFFNRHRGAFEAILYFYQSKSRDLIRPAHIPIHVFLNELIFFDLGSEVIENFQIEAGIKEKQEIAERPKLKLFQYVWDFLDNPESSKAAKLFAIASVMIIVLSLVMFVMETTSEFSEKEVTVNGTTSTVPSKHATWMYNTNTAVIIWFTVEYVTRFIVSPNKWKFLTGLLNVIDFLSILPFYVGILLSGNSSLSILRVVRVVRVLRVFKLSRHSRGLQILGNTLKASVNELMMLAFFLFVVILIFGSCVYYAEQSVKGSKFTSIPASFWWAIVTMTTVGYGDMTPATLWGKLIGGLAVVCGVLTIALPVPVVVSNFEYFYTKERNRKKMEEAKNNTAGNGSVHGLIGQGSKACSCCIVRLQNICYHKRRKKEDEDTNDNELQSPDNEELQCRSNGDAVYISIEPTIDLEYSSAV